MRGLTWLGRNWKPLLSVLGAILVSAFTFIRGLDARFTDTAVTIENVDRAHTERIDDNERAVQQIGEDIGEIKCMIVEQSEGENPLSCIADR